MSNRHKPESGEGEHEGSRRHRHHHHPELKPTRTTLHARPNPSDEGEPVVFWGQVEVKRQRWEKDG